VDSIRRMCRRSFLAGTTLVSASALLSACGGAPAVPTALATEVPPTVPAAATPTEAPAAQSAPTTGSADKLVVWKFGGSGPELEYFPRQNELFSKKTGIQLDYSNNEGSVRREKIIAAFRAKRIADVVLPDGQSIPDLVSLGVILALDDLDRKLTDSWKPNFIPEIWNTTMYQGKWYALPPYVDTGTFLTYNKKIFAEAGITKVPANWDELRDTAKKLTKADRPGITISATPNPVDANTFEGIAYANGGRWLDDTGKKVTIAEPGFVDVLQLYVDLVNAKVVPPGVTTTPFSSSGVLFFQEKVAMWASLSFPGAIQQTMKVRDDFPLGFGLFPRQDKPSGSAPPASMIMTPTAAFMITSLSQKRDAALQYLDYWAQPDAERAWDGSVVVGRVPGLKANWESPTFKQKYPDWQALYKSGQMFAGAQPMPAFPGLAEAEKSLSTAVQTAILGTASPRDALAAGAKSAQAIIDESNS
jgi:multiple sugar transport system substrate-binding protein